jgi:secreted trypsin-like serine protease
MLRSFWAVTALAAAVVTFGVAGAGAIQFGEPDGNRHPWVGLVVLFDENDAPFLRCTGSLLSATVLLTAAHCTGPDLAAGTPAPTSARIWFDKGPILPDPDYAGGSCSVGGPYTGYPCAGEDASGTPAPHPGWSGLLTLPQSSDVGVVRITSAASLPGSFGTLAPVGYLDRLATKSDKQSTRFTIVGYGAQDWRPVVVASVQRLTATVELVNRNSVLLRPWNVQVSGSPGKGKGPGGICYGDSGGPLLHDTGPGEVIVAVSSYVYGPNCTGPSGFYRVDTTYAQSFIAGR